MRQGQQNRRGRGRGGNGANNNRKAQNPLSRSYESSGPDVKIRGTAAQIAEKYATLARDASSSGDTIMAENYLQHAEHYNRIIMAAQAQNTQPTAHNGSESSHAMNGAHRNSRDANGASREQPQPHISAYPSEETQQPAVQQPKPQPSEAVAEQPEAEQPKEREQAAAEEAAPARPAPAKRTRKTKEAAKDAADSEAEGGRRRRRRYPGSNGSGRGASSEGEGEGDGEASGKVSEDQTTDEATA